ncbi:hypothetical protein JVU11DRAFT_11704 [Chiua virens]|nr:hypothetical protein JVU11DRAFT_11704 [Chiua virens]
MAICDQHHFVRLRVYSDEVAANDSAKYLVLEESRLWSNQMDIIYSFLDDESEDSLDLYKKKAFVTTAMNEYTKFANVKFILAEKQDRNAAHVRFSFRPGTERGTMVGTDALMVNSGPTVTLGGMDLGRDDTSNFAMALHSIGHVLGLLHEVEGNSTNFRQYDGFSVMAYSGEVSDRTELSDSDKAWLTLNYTRAPLNTSLGPKDIWTPHRSLRVLDIDSIYSAKILKTDDLMERRLIYCQFLASAREHFGRSVLTNLKGLGVYPVAIPSQKGDLLQKLQAQTRPTAVPGRMSDEETPHPVEIEQYAYSLLRAFGISLDPIAPRSNIEIQSQPIHRYARAHPIPSGGGGLVQSFSSDEELPSEEMLTRAELDELMVQLPGVLNQIPSLSLNGPDIVLPTDVQHGPLYWIRWRAVRKVLRWFSRMVSRKSHDVRLLPPQINETILDLLERNTAQNIFQEIYHLCFASTLVHDLNGTQADLQAKHQELLEGLLPRISDDTDSSWELKWGPVVWKEKPDDTTGGPDLVWYVAYNSTVSPPGNAGGHPTCVIAIAGTQMRSIYTWLHANLHVTSVVDFDSWVANGFKPKTTVNVSPDKPYIAMGTARTLGRLLTERAPPGSMSAGQTLLQFLKSANQSQVTRFIITGHSLGAALTPTLALALDQAGIISHDRILTYPIAGPSPGNRAFATRFSDNFPAKRDNPEADSYKVWNLNLVNEYDPVPHAWSFNKLQTLLKMFPGFHLKLSIRVIVYWVFDDLARAGVQYAPIQSQRFSSSVDGVLEQHSGAYHELVGITPPALRHVLT